MHEIEAIAGIRATKTEEACVATERTYYVPLLKQLPGLLRYKLDVHALSTLDQAAICVQNIDVIHRT